MPEIYFDRFSSFRSMIHNQLNEEWNWELESRDEHGKIISEIYTEKQRVNIYEFCLSSTEQIEERNLLRKKKA